MAGAGNNKETFVAVSWFALLVFALLALVGSVLLVAIVVALTTTRRRHKDENEDSED